MGKEVLVVDKLCCGDRPSIIAAGMMLAQALRKEKVVVVGVNVLGQVVLMSKKGFIAQPNVADSDLDELDEDTAISLMVEECRSSYLRARKVRSNG